MPQGPTDQSEDKDPEEADPIREQNGVTPSSESPAFQTGRDGQQSHADGIDLQT